MVRPWFSGETEKSQGFAVVGFVRVAAAAVMGCVLGCFRAKNHRSHQTRPIAHDDHALSSLLLSDDDSLRNRGKARKVVTEDVEARELKNEAMFLKACGTLPKTPLEIRKTSGKWADSSSNEEKSLNFNSWLPTASVENLRLEKQHEESPPLVKYSEESVIETSCFVDTPTSCMADGHDPRRSSNSSTQSSDVQVVMSPTDVPDNETYSPPISSIPPAAFTSSAQVKNKSVRFKCERSKITMPFSNSSASKLSPYPTPLKLSDEMKTPGTVFPAYSNENMANRKTNKIRSQYVYSVLNPIDNPSTKSLKPKDEKPLVSVPMPGISKSELSVGKYGTHEGGFCGSNVHPHNQNDDRNTNGENVNFGMTPGDRPILGTVATHWNGNSNSHISPKWLGGNGIPNSTSKYQENQKVNWHATPFVERLEKVLSEEAFASQRKVAFGGS